MEERNSSGSQETYELWDKAIHNEWNQWARVTAKRQVKGECILCAAYKPKLEVVPPFFREKGCMDLNVSYVEDEIRCMAWCLMARAANSYSQIGT